MITGALVGGPLIVPGRSARQRLESLALVVPVALVGFGGYMIGMMGWVPAQRGLSG